MAARPDGYLFGGRKKGTPLSVIENSHKRVLKESGLAFVIYDFRHTFATRFAEATSGDVVALASILGHQNLRTVMRYVHVSREHRRNQMLRFVAAQEMRVPIRVPMPAPKWTNLSKPGQTKLSR